MITIKNTDTKSMEIDLYKALDKASEEGVFETFRVQKYNDKGETYWNATFSDKNEGIQIFPSSLTKAILSALQNLYENFNEIKWKELLITLERIIEDSWHSKDTIIIKYEIYQDHYDLNGVKRSDFI